MSGIGALVGLAGNVTYSNKKFEPLRGGETVPDDRLLIETDSPYLVPQVFRGKQRRNEPAHVVETARFLAELRGKPVERLAAATTANARRLFRLPERRVEVDYNCLLPCGQGDGHGFQSRYSRRLAGRIRGCGTASAAVAVPLRLHPHVQAGSGRREVPATSTRWKITAAGAKRISPIGWAMGAFEYHQAEEIRIIASKAAANRARDRESLPRLRSFREYWMRKH